MSRDFFGALELVSEACAHLVFVRTFDHPSAQDSFESKRRQIHRGALARQDQFGHRRAYRRRGLESRSAETRRNEQALDTWHRAYHGARVRADVVNSSMAARVGRVGHRGDPPREALTHRRYEVVVVALAKVVGIRLGLGLPSAK